MKKNKTNKGFSIFLILSIFWFCYGVFGLTKPLIGNEVGYLERMPAPKDCYDANGNITSYATKCIGEGMGCNTSNCPPGTTETLPVNPE